MQRWREKKRANSEASKVSQCISLVSQADTFDVERKIDVHAHMLCSWRFDSLNRYNGIGSLVGTDRRSFHSVCLDRQVWIHTMESCRNRLRKTTIKRRFSTPQDLSYKDRCISLGNHSWQLENFHNFSFRRSRVCVMDTLALSYVRWDIRRSDNSCASQRNVSVDH